MNCQRENTMSIGHSLIYIYFFCSAPTIFVHMSDMETRTHYHFVLLSVLPQFMGHAALSFLLPSSPLSLCELLPRTTCIAVDPICIKPIVTEPPSNASTAISALPILVGGLTNLCGNLGGMTIICFVLCLCASVSQIV